MMFLLLRYSIPWDTSSMNCSSVCRDRSWGTERRLLEPSLYTGTVNSSWRRSFSPHRTYKRVLSQSGQQQERVQVSVLHEWQDHHGDGQPLAGTLMETHSYWTGQLSVAPYDCWTMVT